MQRHVLDGGRLVPAVVEPADDEGVVQGAPVEGDQHLVADVQREDPAAARARPAARSGVQSLTYVSSSHGNCSFTRPCLSGSFTSVTSALATLGSRGAGRPRRRRSSPYSERHCRPLTVTHVS